MEHILLERLSRIFRQGVCDFNGAAKRLRVPVSVVQAGFAEGLLKGYWKIAGDQLLIKIPLDTAPKRPSTSCPGENGFNNITAA